MRLAFNKPVIIIKDESTKYSFDPGIIKHINYPSDLNVWKMERFEADLLMTIVTIFEATENNSYESFLDSLDFKSVKPAHIMYGNVDFNEFVFETLNSLEYSVRKLIEKSNSKARIAQEERNREPLRIALNNLIESNSVFSAEDIQHIFNQNTEIQNLMSFDVFYTFATQYLEDRDIYLR